MDSRYPSFKWFKWFKWFILAKWTHTILGSNGSNGSFRYPEKRKILVVSEKNWLLVKKILAVNEKILVVSEKILVVSEKF